MDPCALDAAPEYGDLLPKDDILEGESRSISEQRVDEREEMGDPGHRDILTRDHKWSRVGACDPAPRRVWELVLGFREAHSSYEGGSSCPGIRSRGGGQPRSV